MAWRLAKSLIVLRNQVDMAYPKRSKVSDGTIGDASHQASASDHNPNAQNVVCALDLTHDPEHGVDIHKIARNIAKNPHPNLKYIISNRQIAEREYSFKWREYGGANPHDKHAHFSVGVGADGQSKPPYDSTIKWNIKEDNVVTDEEKLKSEPIFNASYYLNAYADVRKKYKLSNAHVHWLKNGISEGRKSAPNFHVKEYLANYSDLRKAFGKTGYRKACLHYFNKGINENRAGTSSLLAKLKGLIGG